MELAKRIDEMRLTHTWVEIAEELFGVYDRDENNNELGVTRALYRLWRKAGYTRANSPAN